MPIVISQQYAILCDFEGCHNFEDHQLHYRYSYDKEEYKKLWREKGWRKRGESWLCPEHIESTMARSYKESQ